jgi:hypothetical protein
LLTYLLHSLNNSQIAEALPDNTHRHVRVEVVDLEEIWHPVVCTMRRVGT